MKRARSNRSTDIRTARVWCGVLTAEGLNRVSRHSTTSFNVLICFLLPAGLK